jgi:hypothetical protein
LLQALDFECKIIAFLGMPAGPHNALTRIAINDVIRQFHPSVLVRITLPGNRIAPMH